MRRAELLRSFRHPGFGLLWVSICLNSYSNHISTVALTWLALQFTGSPVGVGAALAIRILPKLFLSVPFGSLSDRMDRRTLLEYTNWGGAAMSVIAVFASVQGWFGFGGVMLVATMVGVFDVAQTTLAKAYVYDVVGSEDAVNGLALEQLANRIFGVVGGISTGFALWLWGDVGAFVMMAATYFGSAALLAMIPRFAPETAANYRDSSAEADEDAGERTGVWASVFEIMRSPAVLLFTVIAMAAEVFAYSHEALAPSFARDVLMAGEQGLGNLVAVRNGGGVVGALLLGSVGRRVRADRLLPMVCVFFGAMLVVFSMSTSYSLSLLLMGLVGIAWAGVDALLPTALQQNVDDSDRGAVVGVWNLSRGVGPLGQLEVGALATVIGVAATQALNGAVFAIIVILVMVVLRRQRTSATSAPDSATP